MNGKAKGALALQRVSRGRIRFTPVGKGYTFAAPPVRQTVQWGGGAALRVGGGESQPIGIAFTRLFKAA
jgi:hypothetical protein